MLVLAFAAQVVCDAGAGFLRTWLAERTLPREQMQMLWLYATELCLSCAGLLVAASAATHPGLVLLSLPMIAMLGLFARERQQRFNYTLELSSAYRGTAQVLSDVIEAGDEYTGLHSREVVDLAVAVADHLGLQANARLNVEFGALLHDVGKIRVPTEIIRKPGKLTGEEWEIIRRHTIEGEAILEKVGGRLARVGKVVRSSHERYDGAGYTDRLAGDQIPIESRIIGACDAFNAMTTTRSYRAAMALDDAVAELERCAGGHFDPGVVAALVRHSARRLIGLPALRVAAGHASAYRAAAPRSCCSAGCRHAGGSERAEVPRPRTRPTRTARSRGRCQATSRSSLCAPTATACATIRSSSSSIILSVPDRSAHPALHWRSPAGVAQSVRAAES